MAALVDDAELAALLASVEAHDEDASAELRASFELEELLGPAGGEELVLSADVAIDKVDAALLGDVDATSDSSDSQATGSAKLRPAPLDWSESPLPASSPSSDGQSSDPQPPAAQQEPRRRRRQKDEIDYLRKKAVELEAELVKLKARADAGLPVVDDEPSCALGPFALDDSTAGSETQEKPLFWQRIARRQLHSRYRAQRENEQLKEMVEGQLGIIRGLEKVLKKRAAIEGTQQWLDDRKRTRVVHDSEAVIFEKLKMDLDGRFKQTESVFEGNSYATRHVDGNNFQIKVDGTDGMFVEFVTSKIVPFGLPETSDAFWRCFTRGNMELKDGHFSLIDNTDDTLAAKMVLSVRENNYTVLRDAKFVVRRYIEENQSVFIWACQAEAEGSLTKAKGLQVFDLGWTRVKPLTQSPIQQAAADEDMHVTIIQTCARVKIKLPAALEHTQEDIVFLTDLVTGSYMTNMVGIHQAIEDLLVEETLQKGW